MSRSARSVTKLFEEFVGATEAGANLDPRAFARRLPDPADRDRFRELVASYGGLQSVLPFAGEPPREVDGYRIGARIARGGMGVVYEAVAPDGRPCALKMLPEQLFLAPAHVRRFERELRLLAELEHPHIVKVLDVGVQRERPWLAMERLDGGTLEDRILELRREKRVPTAEECRATCRLIACIARAVVRAHQQGVLHRDIKPSNILFDDAGEPRLADFGLARPDQASTLTSADELLGTPAYLAPERLFDPLAGRDRRVDVYGLGVTLYESLTGSLPFQGSLTEIVAAARLGPPAPRLFLGHALGGGLEEILERAVAFPARNRYPDAAALADDLEAWLAGGPVAARRGARRRRLLRWVWRHPIASAAGAVLLAAAASFGANRSLEAAENTREAKQLMASARPHIAAFHERVAELQLLYARGPLPGKPALQAKHHLATLRLLTEQAFDAAHDLLLDGLLHRPQDRALRTTLGELHGAMASWLFDEGDFRAARGHEAEAARWDDEAGPPAAAALAVTTDPVGAELRLFRYDREPLDEPWPLVPVALEEPVRTPWRLTGLPPGSYLLELRRPGSDRAVRHPVLLRHGAEEVVAALPLPPDGDFEDGWCWVTPGEFWAGGDPRALNAEPRSRKRLEQGFWVQERETTLGEWFAFLVDVAERGTCPGEAVSAHPDWMTKDVHHPRVGMNAQAEVSLEQARAGGVPNLWLAHCSVHGISYYDATHFVAWRNARAEEQGEPWHYFLPSDAQWERMARGADGRPYPWGDGFDWRWTNSKENPDLGDTDGMLGGSCPTDRSPFGVLDLSGNVREFTSNRRPGSASTIIVRGGEESWLDPNQFRLAGRTFPTSLEFNWDFGLRLARKRR